jgi:hypothetical protein
LNAGSSVTAVRFDNPLLLAANAARSARNTVTGSAQYQALAASTKAMASAALEKSATAADLLGAKAQAAASAFAARVNNFNALSGADASAAEQDPSLPHLA